MDWLRYKDPHDGLPRAISTRRLDELTLDLCADESSPETVWFVTAWQAPVPVLHAGGGVQMVREHVHLAGPFDTAEEGLPMLESFIDKLFLP